MWQNATSASLFQLQIDVQGTAKPTADITHDDESKALGLGLAGKGFLSLDTFFLSFNPLPRHVACVRLAGLEIILKK